MSIETRPKRPRGVTWLLVLVLSFTGGNMLRFYAALETREFLSSLPLSVSPALIALSGFIWSLVGFGVAWGLWSVAAWAPWATRVASLAYAAYTWLDRLTLSASPLRSGNQPFVLAATFILLGFVLWVLARSGVRAYFGENDERKRQD